jgi:hypothetical protein
LFFGALRGVLQRFLGALGRVLHGTARAQSGVLHAFCRPLGGVLHGGRGVPGPFPDLSGRAFKPITPLVEHAVARRALAGAARKRDSGADKQNRCRHAADDAPQWIGKARRDRDRLQGVLSRARFDGMVELLTCLMDVIFDVLLYRGRGNPLPDIARRV